MLKIQNSFVRIPNDNDVHDFYFIAFHIKKLMCIICIMSLFNKKDF